MRLPTLKEVYLSELLVHGNKSNPIGSYVLSYKENLWLLNDENFGEYKEHILKSLGLTSLSNEVEDFSDVMQYIDDKQIPAVVGEVSQDKMLYINAMGSYTMDPKSSVAVKKIVDQLKLKGAITNQQGDFDSEEITKKKKMIGQIPQVVYHGTSAKYLSNILRVGLTPKPEQSNYPRLVRHEDLIFFTSKFEEARIHAVHTSEITKDDPVVLELTIPDKAKIVADWDVDREFAIHGSEKMSREYGIYGYKGRIPATFIKAVHVVPNAFETQTDLFSIPKSRYVKLTKKQLKNYLYTKDEIGYADIYYNPKDYEED
jgi:hypothetical protein